MDNRHVKALGLLQRFGMLPRQFRRAFTVGRDVHLSLHQLGDLFSPQPIAKVVNYFHIQKNVRVIVVDQNDNHSVFCSRSIF